MRIDGQATIAGLPALQVRDALRACRGADGFYAERLAARLGLAPSDAASVLDELVSARMVRLLDRFSLPILLRARPLMNFPFHSYGKA